MNNPAHLKYATSHEWARIEDDGTVSVGITDHAQEQLGDVVFVEAPAVGKKITQGKECGVVESVKAAADIFAPLSGEVVAINDDLGGAPEKLNADPYGAWMFRVRPDNIAELERLMDAASYAKTVAEDGH
ncbi:MAG: glycine cleavage system protein GcvH [Betaproteobacteria bacterium]|nr:glycine cleavage system protein GcvH [Betaproteobacteria bacterium]